MDAVSVNSSSLSLTDVVGTAIQIPGVNVSRGSFLYEAFGDRDEDALQRIIKKAPVEAGIKQSILKQKAHNPIQTRTALSAGTSFAAGIPWRPCHGGNDPG